MDQLIHRVNPKLYAAITLIAAYYLTTYYQATWDAHAANSNPFNLSITTHLGDAQTFRADDIVSFYISLDKDAYLTILYEDAAGRVSVLLPNNLHPNNFFTAGLFIPIPNEQNPYQFRITAPFGKETLWVFASDKPLPTSTDHTIASVRNTFKRQCRKQNALCEEASLGITTTAR